MFCFGAELALDAEESSVIQTVQKCFPKFLWLNSLCPILEGSFDVELSVKTWVLFHSEIGIKTWD